MGRLPTPSYDVVNFIAAIAVVDEPLQAAAYFSQ
jgi:hypothetical protein